MLLRLHLEECFRLGNCCRTGLLWCGLLLGNVTASSVLAQDRPPVYQAYPLRHIAPDDVLERLRKFLAESAPGAQVFSDPQANQILLVGSTSAQQMTASVLRTLDQPSARPVEGDRDREVQGHHVDGDLAKLIAQLQERYPASTGARFVADERNRQVIVVGPPAIQQQVAQLLQGAPDAVRPAISPEAPPANGQGDNLVHRLRNITWRDLESELVRLWGEQLEVTRLRNGEVVNVSIANAAGAQPVLQINRRTGEVALTGAGPLLDQWRRVLEAIDSPQDGEIQTQLVTIRNADPNLLESTVGLLNQGTKPAEDQVTQGVVRRARRRSAADLVSSLLQQPPAAGQPAAPAQPGAPNQPAAEQPAPAQPGAPGEPPADDGDLGLIGSVQIEIINDTIILRGNRRDVERVKKLIEEIDEMANLTRPEYEIYHLQYINGEAATTLVSELYTEILADLTGKVTIRALGEPNAILLIGRKESLVLVKELIQKLDQPSPPTGRFEIFRLKHVSALDAEQTVRNFFVNRVGFDTNPRNFLGTRVQVLAEYRTNSLIVQASPRDMEEVRRMIASIDVEEVGSTNEIRIFKLKNALADTLATVIQSAISGQAAAGGQQQAGQPGGQGQQQGGTATQSQARAPSQSLQLKIIDQNGGGVLLRSGILADVQVTADANNNSLIVRAPAKSMELIGALIEQLDKLPDANAVVKVFEIRNGNATTLAQMLQQLFGQQVTAGQGATNALGGLFGGAAQLQSVTGGGETSLIPLRFAVDQRTNTIIASGSEGDLLVVDTILVRLDEELDDRRLTVVRLRNTQASSVATAVQQYLTNLQQQVQQQLLSQQNISAFESVERQVFVIPENVTNSLIVSATPRYQEEILKVIEDLDIRPPMVMVQVLIAEVTLDDTVEAGAEFGLQNSLVFNRGRAVPDMGGVPTANSPSDPGFNFNGMDRNPLTNLALLPNYPNTNSLNQNTLAGQALSHFATGHTSALGYGGFVFSAASDSISILLRALMDENRLQIPSRPQVMTMHNQPAYVQVGANVARPGESTITGTGAVQQSVDYVDTGLILSILPLINDDGVIVLGVEAERSALGAENDPNATEIGSGAGGTIVIKPLNITKASTTISARDGQTVVFAGLIQKSNVFNSRRVPYLSDVPFIGNFFKFESSNERRSELLVIMTPHLIRDESDIELIKAQESERMSWCLADVVNVTGDWGLQGGSCAFCKNEAPLIFPDLDPTGTMHPPTPDETQYSSTAPFENPFGGGEGDSQLRPLPASAGGAIGASAPNFAPAPPGQGHPAAMHPVQEVSPASYRAVRLPAPQ